MLFLWAATWMRTGRVSVPERTAPAREPWRRRLTGRLPRVRLAVPAARPRVEPDMQPRRPASQVRTLGRWAMRAALAGLALAWLALLRPQALGGPAIYMIVRGDSMLPAYDYGDLLLITAQPSYSVGDAVAYRVPEGELGAGMLVVHRIAGVGPEGGFVMRGDNNPSNDPWRPGSELIAGKVVLDVPKVGQLIGYALQPVTAGALGAALMVMIVLARRDSESRGRLSPRTVAAGA